MSRTPIRDRPLRQPLIRHSRHPLVNPAPNSSFRRRPESRGAGRGECSAGACPPLGSGWGVAESAVPTRHTKSQLRVFIPSCAGASQHERLVRKHVPDSDPGSIPAPAGDTNHRRPNNDSPGSQERCSAGACPPLGSGWGVAESAVPIRCTKPQLRLFIPSCAGASQHERLVRKHVPDSDPGWMFAVTFVGLGRPGEARHPRHPPRHSRESGNLGEVWVVAMKLDLSHQPMLPIFIPWCAGTSRHVQLVRKHVPDSDPGSIPAPAGGTNHRHPNNDSPGSQEKCSAGACPQPGVGCVAQTTPDPSINQCTQFSYLGVPARAIGTKACPGLRSGINSGTGRRRQLPSPEQRQPRVARKM